MATVTLQRGPIGAELRVNVVLELIGGHAIGVVQSRDGTTIGGWLTMRCLPSTTSASLESACRLSRVCAFAATCFARSSAAFAAFFCALPLRDRSVC